MLNRPIWSEAVQALLPQNDLDLELEEQAK
jgi:hypothetical protein